MQLDGTWWGKKGGTAQVVRMLIERKESKYTNCGFIFYFIFNFVEDMTFGS